MDKNPNILPFIANQSELTDTVLTYGAEMANLPQFDPATAHDAVQAVARARAWVAIPDGEGGYLVSFAKFCGYKDNTLPHYSKYRKTRDETRLDGTEAERRIKALGGTSYAVGHSVGLTNSSRALRTGHAAVDAVRDFVRSFGKEPSALAEVRVFEDARVSHRVESAPEVFNVLLAAINAAQLTEGALDDLFARVKAQAIA